MFQRLTRLFFSDQPSNDTDEPKPIVCEEEDDGWLIIDIPDCYDSIRDDEAQEEDNIVPSPLSHSLAERIGWSIPPHPPQSMDESWFVTPPPCFTAEAPGDTELGTSPLEDLLIEHPSMSVYITNGSIVMEQETAEITIIRPPSKTRVERRTPHHVTSTSAKAAILGKVGQVSRLQRAKAIADKHKISRKNLQRQNLAREIRGRSTNRHRDFICQPRQRQCYH
ncbi:hypothetical protein GDO86_013897 [Hymenochirus boettgeri]|uniref:Tumor protein p53-inducible nuclear protein 2 n=1 Tax=Hymenochirus boettgeri TaxID=247094 RepID=A0A8T2JLR6_9PIPI|nr:hypothetical protein GDO86_013897 [Hymenochirus boettgeri]